MPKLIRFVLVNSLIGMVIGWLVAAGIIWFDVSGFGQRFAQSSDKPVIVLILAVSFGVTFAFAYLATAILLLPTDKDDFDRL